MAHKALSFSRKYAWGSDEVKPVTLSASDTVVAVICYLTLKPEPSTSRSGWGVTIIDALPTMVGFSLDLRVARSDVRVASHGTR